MSERVPATPAAPAAPARVQRRRRGLLRTYLTPKQAIPRPTVITLGIGSFVAILAVGLAYVWAMGDLEWVKGLKQDVLKAARESREQPRKAA